MVVKTVRRTRIRIIGKVLLWGVGILLVFFLLAWFGGRWYLSRSVGPYAGEVETIGLAQPVEITFDAMGIPQIWAETDADLYFALGWLHASERLFQMELTRRSAQGTLAEVFGEGAFEYDVHQRQLGFQQMAERVLPDLERQTLSVFEAYTQGINAWIEQAPVLPPEFALLRFEPQPWQVMDIVTLTAFHAWYTVSLGDSNASTDVLLQHFGDDMAAALNAIQPGSPPRVGESVISDLLKEGGAPLQMARASNAWVVAPGRSISGAAMLASDPHLNVSQAPGFWYLVGLHSVEGSQGIGATVPGIPTIVIGHNGSISWAVTAAQFDVVDHFSETLHPEDSTLVMTTQGYRPMEVRVEEIGVKGEDLPRRVPVYTTPRGVLVERDGISGTSLRWAGDDRFGVDVIQASLDWARAQEFGSFRKAVQTASLNLNWIYADRAGNIGYQFGPPLPRRTYNSLRQQSALDSTARWEGYYADDLVPHAYNPPEGWLASANNQPRPIDPQIPLPGFYYRYRIQRVEALLSEPGPFSARDMERMQEDFTSAVALNWKELAAEGAERLGDTALAARFRTWDGQMTTDDTLATVFAFWWPELRRNLFEDELGGRWNAGRFATEYVLMNGREAIIDDVRTPDEETRADISARALRHALEEANNRPLGAVQTLTVRHPLSRVSLLDRWLNLSRGPYPRGGDGGTLNATGDLQYEADSKTLSVHAKPSLRLVLDWANVDSMTVQLPFGQSGNPLSPHYGDFLDMTERGERWVLPFSKEAVYSRTATLLRLIPAGNG